MLKSAWVRRCLLVVGAGLCAIMVSRFPLSEIGNACLELGPWVSVLPFIALGTYALNSNALRVLLDGDIPWTALMWNRVVGEGYNSLLPAAGVGGEPFKLKELCKYIDTHRAIVALITDRLIDNSIALLYSAGAVAVGAFTIPMTPVLRTSFLTYAAMASALSVVLIVVMTTSLTSKVGGRLARLLGAERLDNARFPVSQVLRAAAWQGTGKLVGLLELGVLLHLLGLPYTLGSVFFLAGALSAAGFIGGAIPQGLGVQEVAAVGVFELMHYPGAAAVAFALARRGRMLLVAVIGVLLHLAFGRVASEPMTRQS
jgi:hypothetical protein